MKEFTVKKSVVVESTVVVLANSEEEANQLVDKHIKHVSKIDSAPRLTMRILESKEVLDVTPKL